MATQLLFQNERFVAADKAAGWLSVPSRLGKDDARRCLGRELEAQLGIRLWPVHRLDQEVTGLILFAKDEAAHRAAGAWFEQRQVVKTYEALTGAAAPPAAAAQAVTPLAGALVAGAEFVWRSQLARGKRRAYLSAQGKPAETQARFVRRVPIEALDAGLWQLHPHTGRPHQLRFDLARHGHPIIGDELYGSATPFRTMDGIALRCVELDFALCPKYTDYGLPPKLRAIGLLSLVAG